MKPFQGKRLKFAVLAAAISRRDTGGAFVAVTRQHRLGAKGDGGVVVLRETALLYLGSDRGSAACSWLKWLCLVRRPRTACSAGATELGNSAAAHTGFGC